jgi:hypothetical protein
MVRLTAYATQGFEFIETASKPYSTCGRVIEALPNAFGGISHRGDVEQSLVGSGILYNSGSLTIHGENDRALGFELLEEVG